MEGEASDSQMGVWIFYVVFLAMLVGEGFVVGLVLTLAKWMGVAGAGPPMAWVVFIIGGSALGYIELRTIRPQQRMRDPVLKACCWLQVRLGVVGYLANALVIGGAPGSAVALTHAEHPHRRRLTYLAAVLFASLWVPLFVLVWR